jgi:cation diffusion facilitator family transporter
MSKPECIACGNRVAWIGIGANALLVILKIAVGIAAGSKACLADALHSATNIFTAFFILISRKYVTKPIDERHPYGYGKVEFIASATVSINIIIFTAVLVILSLESIIHKPSPPPHPMALVCAVISILANEMLFRYFRCVGFEVRSQTIIANAWTNRADSFSSLVVLFGVLGSRLGFHHLDPIAAVIIGAIIVKVSIDNIKEAVAGLMDANIRPETMVAIDGILRNLDEVQNIRHLRARLAGDEIWIDVGIQIASKYTVSECDEIRNKIALRIRESVQGVGDIFVDFSVPETG